MVTFMNPTTDAPSTYAPSDAVAYHGRLAPDWEARYRKRSFRARVDAVEECLLGQSLVGRAWLDAGCGTGTLSRILADRGCDVTGVDAAAGMIRVAQEQATQAASGDSRKRNLRFEVCGTIERLPLAASSLDGVLCSSVLEYVDAAEEVLIEFFRVLKPGGLLLVSVPNSQSIVRRAQVAAFHLGRRTGRKWLSFVEYSRNEYSVTEFGALLQRCGFGVDKVLVFGSPMPRWMQRLRSGGSLLMFRAARQ